MKLVWVAGRVPKKPRAICGLCMTPIVEGYLHELDTHLYYCCMVCYTHHVALAASYFASKQKLLT